jgi:uncharacterized membrane protein
MNINKEKVVIDNKEITTKARESLSNQWNLAIGTFFVFLLISGLGNEVSLLIGGAMQLGASIFALNIARGKKAEFSQLFDGFKNFANSLVANLLMIVFILLWMLLLIIPGIIAAIAYSQTFFIMADDKKISGSDAIKKSKQMMMGHKGKYFMLCLRFSGWFILSILTLGIGFLWLVPYVSVSMANFYDAVKK